jgi:hypothetical protein
LPMLSSASRVTRITGGSHPRLWRVLYCGRSVFPSWPPGRHPSAPVESGDCSPPRLASEHPQRCAVSKFRRFWGPWGIQNLEGPLSVPSVLFHPGPPRSFWTKLCYAVDSACALSFLPLSLRRREVFLL